MITGGLIFVMIWCMGWAIVGVGVMPGGNLFGLLMIFYCAFIGGKVTELIHLPSIPRLPPLLGMLLAGFIIRNIPAISSVVYVDRVWSSTLRNIALTVILVRAGLGLDPEALKTMKGVCLRLSVAPCMMEALSAAIFSHLLMKFPWDWALLLGFVVGAVSPAVVVPSMLYLQEQGYGVDKGIPTLLVAASSLDDIVAITGFNTCISIIFSSGGVITNLLHSLRDIILGVLVGAALGLVLRYFPSDDQAALHVKRSFLVLSMCVWAVLGSQRAGFHAAGGLCTLVLTFIAGINWSKQKSNVQRVVAITWNVFQPLLFGLVGAEISVVSLKSNAIGISVATISLALLVRISFTFLLMSYAGFNCKEKMFIALAWMPKATVQMDTTKRRVDRGRQTPADLLQHLLNGPPEVNPGLAPESLRILAHMAGQVRQGSCQMLKLLSLPEARRILKARPHQRSPGSLVVHHLGRASCFVSLASEALRYELCTRKQPQGDGLRLAGLVTHHAQGPSSSPCSLPAGGSFKGEA